MPDKEDKEASTLLHAPRPNAGSVWDLWQLLAKGKQLVPEVSRLQWGGTCSSHVNFSCVCVCLRVFPCFLYPFPVSA